MKHLLLALSFLLTSCATAPEKSGPASAIDDLMLRITTEAEAMDVLGDPETIMRMLDRTTLLYWQLSDNAQESVTLVITFLPDGQVKEHRVDYYRKGQK